MSNQIQKPKTYGDIVALKLLGINAAVETEEVLEAGAILASDDGESWAAYSSAGESAILGVLCDYLPSSGTADVLLAGEVRLSGIDAALKTALLKQKIVVK